MLWGLLAALAVFPFIPAFPAFYTHKLASILIFATFAMSLDLLVGATRLVSLGHAAFFGIGGYALAVLSPQDAAASLWLALPASILAAALAALVVGALTVRTAGIYFIMATLAFGQMAFHLFADTKIAGGSDGAFVNFRPVAAVAGRVLIDLTDKTAFYYAALAAAVGTYLLLRRLLDSPAGRVMRGIGMNEPRVAALGYDTFLYKLAAFTVAGALAGLAGFLAAAQYGFMNPSMVGWHASGAVLAMVILGGAGTLIGPALGAAALELLRTGLSSLTEHWLLPFGLVVILAVLLLPGGLFGLLGRRREPPDA
jgi:branched-chain amino acid transport system permease protein